MTLMRTSLLNGIAVAIKMLTLLGINKVLAIYVGPAGYAALGQFQNAVQMITTVASGAINTGVTKYTAEYYEDEERQRDVWRTAGTIALAGSVLTGSLVLVFSSLLTVWFLNDESYSGVFVCLALTLVLFVFNTLLLAILNGKKELNRYVIANIAGSLFGLLVTTIMAIEYGLYGTLLALSLYQSLTFFVTLLLCYNASWFKFSYLFGRLDKEIASNLAKYTAMALTSAICIPVSHILIRNHLGDALGWEAAGYWEAMWRLSGAYMLLFTTTLSVYYLPRFAELKLLDNIYKELVRGYCTIMPLFLVAIIVIYLAREYFITFLFTKAFLAMEPIFAWQLVGDFLKMASWIIAFLMHSKGFFKLFIISEILFSLFFYVLSVYFVGEYGLMGMGIAHAVNYLFYFIFICLSVMKLLRIVMPRGNL